MKMSSVSSVPSVANSLHILEAEGIWYGFQSNLVRG
jgi:hypothetical protein